jgi:imidazolonepropionase-like amidohydrolase
MFATTANYKREAYRGSEFAPRILADQGIDVVMKSDHPETNSRYLLHEAQQAFYYGLNASLALASVTTTPARIAGLDHRVGKVKVGWDAGRCYVVSP